MSGSIHVQPIAGALGAELSGVDLSEPLSDAQFSEIHQAFLTHQVIFFRDQSALTPDKQKAFAQRFGTLNVHPYVSGMPGHPELLEIIKLFRHVKTDHVIKAISIWGEGLDDNSDFKDIFRTKLFRHIRWDNLSNQNMLQLHELKVLPLELENEVKKKINFLKIRSFQNNLNFRPWLVFWQEQFHCLKKKPGQFVTWSFKPDWIRNRPTSHQSNGSSLKL